MAQDYHDIEYILWDGISKDNTEKIINKYRDKITKVVFHKDNGPGDASNMALDIVEGDIVGFLFSDDIFFNKNTISSIVAKFQETNCDAVYGDMIYKNKKGRITRYWKASDYKTGSFLEGWSLPFPTFFAKKNIYNQFGAFNLKTKISDDYELLFRLIHLNKIKISRIEKVLVVFNQSGRSSRILNRLIGLKNILKVVKSNNARVNYLKYIFKRYSSKIKEFFYE